MPPASQKGARCSECNRVKVKCSESLPCARCFQLCLSCVPAPHVGSFPELAVSMMNIAEASTTFMRTFNRMQTAGLLGRHSVRALVSAWHAESRRAGADVTHGLLQMVTRAAKLPIAELTSHVMHVGTVDVDCATDERPADAACAEPGVEKCGYVAAWMPSYCVGGILGFSLGRLLGTESVEGPCEGASQSREAVLSAPLSNRVGIGVLNDADRMVVAVAATRKGLSVATNSVADDLFCSATEMTSLMHQYRVLPIHVLASMISPTERHLLYEAQVSMLCSQPRPYTAFLKLCERDGQIELYILQARSLTVLEVPETSGPATVFILERCPASKHLTTRPGHRHRVVERHRKGPRAVIKGKRSGSSTADTKLASLDCLPVSPPGAKVGQWNDASRCDYPTPPSPPITTHYPPHNCLDDQRHGAPPVAPWAAAGSSSCRSSESSMYGLISEGSIGCPGGGPPGWYPYGTHDFADGVPHTDQSYVKHGSLSGGLRGDDSPILEAAQVMTVGPEGCLSGSFNTLELQGIHIDTSDSIGCSKEGGECGEEWLDEIAACLGLQQASDGVVGHGTKSDGPPVHEPVNDNAIRDADSSCVEHGLF